MYFQNEGEARAYINDLDSRIKKYENRIILLEDVMYFTMKKPILEAKRSTVISKWNSKLKSIKQRQKGIKRLNKNIYRFTKEIEYIKAHYLQNL